MKEVDLIVREKVNQTKVSKHHRNGDGKTETVGSLAARGQHLRIMEDLENMPIMESGRVPGATGINNHGNTCYMNAVIQGG